LTGPTHSSLELTVPISSAPLDLSAVTDLDLSLLGPEVLARVSAHQDVLVKDLRTHFPDCDQAPQDAVLVSAPASSLWLSSEYCCDSDPRVSRLASSVSGLVQGLRAGAPTAWRWLEVTREDLVWRVPEGSPFLPHALAALDLLEAGTHAWLERDGLNHLFEVSAACASGTDFPDPAPDLALSPAARALKELPGSVLVAWDPRYAFPGDIREELTPLQCDTEALKAFGDAAVVVVPRGLMPLVEAAAERTHDFVVDHCDVSHLPTSLVETAVTLLRDSPGELSTAQALELAAALL
jgi:hypothetical protein